LTNLSNFLYFVSWILLLEFQYCRVDANNIDRQEQEVKDRENSEQEKEIKEILLFYSIERIFSLRKQLNTKVILNLYKCDTEAVLQTTVDCCFYFQNKKVISLNKSKQSSEAELIQFDR